MTVDPLMTAITTHGWRVQPLVIIIVGQRGGIRKDSSNILTAQLKLPPHTMINASKTTYTQPPLYHCPH